MIRMVEGIRVVYRYEENLEVKDLKIPKAVGLRMTMPQAAGKKTNFFIKILCFLLLCDLCIKT